MTLPLLVAAVVGVAASAVISLTGVPVAFAAQCGNGTGKVQTSFDFGCPDDTDANSSDLTKNPIYIVLLYVINTMSAGVGVAIVGGILWQSVKYASANGQPDKAKDARNGIVNAVIALILFLTMYALLNFVIPGGIFSASDGGAR